MEVIAPSNRSPQRMGLVIIMDYDGSKWAPLQHLPQVFAVLILLILSEAYVWSKVTERDPVFGGLDFADS